MSLYRLPNARKGAPLLAAFGVVGMVIATTGIARAQITSTFSSSSEGWSIVSFGNLSTNDYSIVGTYAPTYNATGGNPGGYISTGDPDTGDFTFSAPSQFLGSKPTATGLTYDLTHPTGAINYQTTDVMLVGNGGQRLLWQSPTAITPGTGFTSVSLSFTPSSAWHVNTTTGATATTSDFSGVLGSLTGIYIRGEYTTGDETAGLDNVRLAGVASTAAPEPGALALLALSGLPALGMIAHRRRRRAS